MEVTVYTKNQCGMCNNTKRFLKSLDVAYIEKNVEENPDFLAEARATGFTSMPIVQAGDEVFAGFQPAKLEELFGSL